MCVIELAREARAGAGCNEVNFADERAAPGLIHARAELPLHAFDLNFPGRRVGSDCESAAFAPDRAGVRGERAADDRGPGGREPGERSFRALQAAQRASQKFSGSFHESRDFSIARGRVPD